MKCPVCEKANLLKGKTRELMFGVDLGEFPAMELQRVPRICQEPPVKDGWNVEYRTCIGWFLSMLRIFTFKD